MKALLLLMLIALTLPALADGFDQWRIRIGLGDNVYPYANDYFNNLGVSPGATWDYDSKDAVNPPT